MNPRRVRQLTLLTLATLGAYCSTQLSLTSSVMHFLPRESDNERIQLSIDLVDSPLARRMVLAISGDGDRSAVANELASRLRLRPEVSWVAAGIDEETYRALYSVYFERRVMLASAHPELEIPALLSPEALERRAAELRLALQGPEAMLVSRTAPSDPLGLFDRVLERVRAFQPPAGALEEKASPMPALVELGLRSSPFDTQRQIPFLQYIEDEFARIAESRGGGFGMEQSGANRVAVAAERSIRGDVNLISALSISVVCALFLAIFRSLRHLLTTLLAPVFGFVLALSIAIATAPSIHGITLAFGFVLLGVAIDYPIHLMNHHALARHGASARESVQRIRGSLVLSGLTTAVAFLSLSLSSLPGLSDMGAFAATGVVASIALTLFALPAFLDEQPAASPTQLKLSSAFIRLSNGLAIHPARIWGLLAIFVAVGIMGALRLQWDDEPASLMALDARLVAEANRVQRSAGAFDGGRFVVGLAPDIESALILNEEIHERLSTLVSGGELGGIGSLRSFLFSQSLQLRNLAAFSEIPQLDQRINRAFTTAGFKRDAFVEFTRALESSPAPLLRPTDFVGTPLERVLAGLVELEGRIAVITLVRDAGTGRRIEESIDGLEGAHYVDQQEIMKAMYAGYRRSTVRMVAIGALFVMAVLQLRYRNPLRGLLAFLPALLGATTTLGVLGFLGVSVNLVSAISLLVVLGMGVDYGVFAVDAANDVERQGSTLTSLLVSCITSVFVFGVLAISDQPVLRAIGLTTGIGVLIALVASPMSLALAKSR